MPDTASVLAAGQDGDVVRVYGKTMLYNRVQREASVIANNFDEICRVEIVDIEQTYSTVASILDFGTREARRDGDEIRMALGIVLSNALKSFTAAFALLFTNPHDFDRFKRDELESTKTFSAAKRLMPVFGRVMGDLSAQFVHVGKPFRHVQKGNTHAANETELWQCLFSLQSLIWFTYQVVELIFFHSVAEPMFWSKTDATSYRLMPKDEAMEWQRRIADRYKQYRPNDVPEQK
jgi:hypothetical protein